MLEQNSKEIHVYVGTYTSSNNNKGIYVYRINSDSGALEFVSTTEGIENPSFLDIDSQRKHLYSVNEVGEFSGEASGGVTAFSIDSKTGKLTYLNQQSSQGKGPCHLSVDKTGQYVLVANYGGGSVSILPIQRNGQIGEATDFVQHQGSSVNQNRQQEPHAHSIMIDPNNRYAFAADLGVDKILIYQLDLAAGKLIPNEHPWVSITPGAGPRHFAFTPNGEYAYLINELDSTITAFTYDNSQGNLNQIQTVPTLPDDFEDVSHCADIHVSPSGKFVYGSNRGHDSLVIFKIEDTGHLSYVDHQLTLGQNPRNFAIDPTGTFLLAANQSTNNIVTFRIDQQTGKLTSTGNIVEVPMPVCIKMIYLP